MPEKQYFSFQQIAKRWHVELQDMYDYAVEEIFVTLAWIGKTHVEFGYYDEAQDGEPFWVPTKRCWHNGYGIVRPLDLREVLRSGGCPVQLFGAPGEKDNYVSIQDDQKEYIIEPRDLMISRTERDRVEKLYDPCNCGCGAGGRKDHRRVIGLCWQHHLGPLGINGGQMSRREWESRYGREAELLERVARLLSRV